MKPWIQTVSGIAFDLDNPQPQAVSLQDIAHALGMLCRWTGHTRRFYSVAEHSLTALRIAQDLGATLSERRAVLFHDAHEAYTGDISSPLKAYLQSMDELCAQFHMAVSPLARCQRDVQNAIDARFNLNTIGHKHVIRLCDEMALWLERDQLLGRCERVWDWMPEEPPAKFQLALLGPEHAATVFLAAASELGIS